MPKWIFQRIHLLSASTFARHKYMLLKFNEVITCLRKHTCLKIQSTLKFFCSIRSSRIKTGNVASNLWIVIRDGIDRHLILI